MTLEVPYRSIPDMFLQARGGDARRAAPSAAPTPTTPAGLAHLGAGRRARQGDRRRPARRSASAARTGSRSWPTPGSSGSLADLGIMCAGARDHHGLPDHRARGRRLHRRRLRLEGADRREPGAGRQDRRRRRCPALTHVVLIDGAADPAAASRSSPWPSWRSAAPRRWPPSPTWSSGIVAGIGPDHLATLIYTSGTTGRPKGVELLHGGWCWEGVAQAELGLLAPDDLQYLWLPLSHSFGKTLLCGIIHVGAADLRRRPGRQDRRQPRPWSSRR